MVRICKKKSKDGRTKSYNNVNIRTVGEKVKGISHFLVHGKTERVLSPRTIQSEHPHIILDLDEHTLE